MNIIPKILLLLLSIGGLSSCTEEDSAIAINTGRENKPLPAFTLIQPDGTSFSSAQFSDKEKLVLFFFSPNCPYCRTQLRETLNNIKKSAKKQICIVLASDKKDLKEFSSYFKLNQFKNISIGVDTGNVVQKAYQVTQVPFTALFNEKKILKQAYLGRLRGKTLISVLQK